MLPVSIVIPTFGRDEVLLSTIQELMNREFPAAEILIMDQTPAHAVAAEQKLASWHESGQIRWLRLPEPSITQAMNRGLQIARCPLVLFLDDDIQVSSELVAAHSAAHTEAADLWATVGQVIQPWQQAAAQAAPRQMSGLYTDFDFPFHSTLDQDVANVMAGNLCVHRERALSIGGFDTNFRGSAFRFETDFARRAIDAGGRIRFLGSAGIRHLRVASGGTRKDGNHLASASPQHGVGDHYYAFLHGGRVEAWLYSIGRVFREVRTRFHLTHPWWIPVKMAGEIRAMWEGYWMARRKKREARGDGVGSRK
ncbi:MAG: glycosyltransferase [Planctomycetaceae bacterium]